MPDSDLTDWRDVTAWFTTTFADMRVDAARRLIPGTNFVTPERLGYVRFHDGDVCEVSTGMFGPHRVYGVTFARTSDEQADDRDRCLTAAADLESYLRTGAL
jgi:hypothetical protein